jgi:hypothetical protein
LPLWRRLQVIGLWRVFALRIARLALHGRSPIAAWTLLARTTPRAALARRPFCLTRWPWIGTRFRAAQCICQRGNVVVIQFDKSPALEAARQHDSAIANANQTADGVTDRFKHAPHLAVAPFRNRHFVPAVGALAAAGFNRTELRHAVVELHTL